MTVLVRIPTILRTYTGGAAEVSAPEGTLREVFAGLDAAYPGLAFKSPQLLAGVLLRDFARNSDDATVLVYR